MPEERPTPIAKAPCRAAPLLALAAILAAALALPADAADRWFRAEIIVFDDLRSEGLHAEHWPADPGAPPLQNAVELTRRPDGAPAAAVHAYRLVSSSRLTLGGVWSRLRRSAHYRPLLHAGWHLPGLPRGSARPVHLGRSLGAGADEAGGEGPSVHGTVKISLARFLRVEVDLLYHRPVSGEAVVPGSAPTRFRLVSERRMRSGELHYIDHPLFGVLILLAPA